MKKWNKLTNKLEELWFELWFFLTGRYYGELKIGHIVEISNELSLWYLVTELSTNETVVAVPNQFIIRDVVYENFYIDPPARSRYRIALAPEVYNALDDFIPKYTRDLVIEFGNKALVYTYSGKSLKRVKKSKDVKFTEINKERT